MKRFLSKSLLGLALLASSYAVACSHQNVETQEEEEKVVENKKTQQASTGTVEETDEHEDDGGNEGGQVLPDIGPGGDEGPGEDEGGEEIDYENADFFIRLNANHLNLGVSSNPSQNDHFLLSAMIDGKNPEAFLVDEGHLVFESSDPSIVKVIENVVDPVKSQSGWASTTQVLVQAVGGEEGDEAEINVWYELDNGTTSLVSTCTVTIGEYVEKDSAYKNDEGRYIGIIDMGPEFMDFQDEEIPLFRHVSQDVPTYIPFIMYSNSRESANDPLYTYIYQGGATGREFDPVTDEEYNYKINYSIQNITYEGEDPVGTEMDWDNFVLNVAPTRISYNKANNSISVNTEVEDPSSINYVSNVFYFPIAGIEGRFSGTVMMEKQYIGSRLGQVETVPTPFTLTFDVEVDA